MGRIPRKTHKGKYSEKYRDHLKLKDFLGELSASEVEIAKKLGLLKWDLWSKCNKSVTYPIDLIQKGWHLAPVFDGYGKIDKTGYPKKLNYFIKNYADLEAYLAEK